MHPEATVTLAGALPGAQAPVAQRIEHLTTDQKVWGSNPYGRARSVVAVDFRSSVVCYQVMSNSLASNLFR